MQDIHADFRNVSQSQSPETIFRILDAVDQMPSVQEVKRRMLSLCQVAPGERVLDVGCGLGQETVRLARLVGPGGRAVGIDKADVMIAEARRRLEPQLPIEYRVGDAAQLDAEEGAYHCCRAERLLMYVDQPEFVVAGMVRALRPGGRMVIFEFDYSETMVDGPNHALTEKLAQALGASVPNRWMGRSLPRLFRQAGLQDVEASLHAYHPDYPMYRRVVEGTFEAAKAKGTVTADELTEYWRGLEARGDAFFAAFPGFVVSGRKPR